MEALAGQLSSLHDQHLRLAAEYDNYRKRTTREKETIYQDAKLDTIAKFLEVYDNLERGRVPDRGRGQRPQAGHGHDLQPAQECAGEDGRHH